MSSLFINGLRAMLLPSLALLAVLILPRAHAAPPDAAASRLAAVPQSSLKRTPEATIAVARAYGFVSGQSIALARIADTHPDLASQVVAARAAFDAAFPQITDKLEAELRTRFGAQAFTSFRREMRNSVIDAQSREPKSAEQARAYLAEVQLRARGDGIDPPVLDYLLAVLYANEPAAEFVAGFRQHFRSDGSGKAQGMRMRLQLPRSWAGSDDERVHIVQKWVSEGGNGDALILLSVWDAQGFNPSSDDVARFIEKGGARELAADHAEFIDAAAYTLETLPGYAASLRLSLVREGRLMLAWAQLYQVFFRGKALNVTCLSSGSESEAAQVEVGMRRLQPLCRQVASSLVLEQLYD